MNGILKVDAELKSELREKHVEVILYTDRRVLLLDFHVKRERQVQRKVVEAVEPRILAAVEILRAAGKHAVVGAEPDANIGERQSHIQRVYLHLERKLVEPVEREIALGAVKLDEIVGSDILARKQIYDSSYKRFRKVDLNFGIVYGSSLNKIIDIAEKHAQNSL